jgi:hypothetical protein
VTAGAVLMVLVAGCGAGEAVVRHVAADRVVAALDGRLGERPEVSFGSRPVLPVLLGGTLGSVTVSGRADAAGFSGVPVVVRLSDVTADRSRHTATVSRSRVTAEVTTDAVARRIASAGGRGTALVSGVTADPAAGTLDLAVRGGLATFRVRPAVAGGRVTLSVTGGEVLGAPAPTALLDRVRSAVGALAEPDGPQRQDGAAAVLGLRPTQVTVTGDGLRVGLTGGKARLGP